MELHEINNTLKYLLSKKGAGVVIGIRTNHIKNEKSFILGDIVKEDKFFKIKDMNGSHIIAGNMVESVLKLKRVVIKSNQTNSPPQ